MKKLVLLETNKIVILGTPNTVRGLFEREEYIRCCVYSNVLKIARHSRQLLQYDIDNMPLEMCSIYEIHLKGLYNANFY